MGGCGPVDAVRWCTINHSGYCGIDTATYEEMDRLADRCGKIRVNDRYLIWKYGVPYKDMNCGNCSFYEAGNNSHGTCENERVKPHTKGIKIDGKTEYVESKEYYRGAMACRNFKRRWNEEMKQSCTLCGHMDDKLVCDIHNSSFIYGRSDSHGCLYHQPECAACPQRCVDCSAFTFTTPAETWGACAHGRKNLHKNSFVCELFENQKEEPMTTYFTKCGREFSKSTKAETTGYHIPEDESGQITDRECSACPFPIDVKEGWPEQRHKRWECRAGSKVPNHENEWIGHLNDKNTIIVRSLNNNFCESVIAFAREHPDLGANYTQDGADCRRHISVSCSGNKKGMAAKTELIDKFFPVQESTEDQTDDPADLDDDGVDYDDAEEICENCGYYKSLMTDLGDCSLKGIPVSKVRPACEDYGPGEVDLGDDNPEDEEPFSVDRCPKYDCPFHVYEGEGCHFDFEEKTRNQDHGSWYKDVRMAVEKHGCEVPKVLKAHRALADEEMASEAEIPEIVIEQPETVPEVIKPVEVEQAPAFDYSELDEQTATFLQEKAKTISQIKVRTVHDIGLELKLAHDTLANHKTGTFGAWCESIGINRRTAENYIQAFEYIAKNFRNIEDAAGIQPSLLFAASKPSAPPELAQAVIDGDITKHKDYIAALKEMSDAKEWGKKQADYAEEHMKRAREAEFELTKKDTAIKALQSDLEFTKGRMKHLEAAVPDSKELDEKRDQIKELETELAELREQLAAKPIEAPAVEVREVIPYKVLAGWIREVQEKLLKMLDEPEMNSHLIFNHENGMSLSINIEWENVKEEPTDEID